MASVWLTNGGFAGGNPILLIASTVSVIFGLILFVTAVRKNDITKQVSDANEPHSETDTVVVDTTHQKSILDQNNDIIKSWSKTYATREKLKMFRVTASEIVEDNKQ